MLASAVASAVAAALALPLTGGAAPAVADSAQGAAAPSYAAGRSHPVEDSYYPAKGDPRVDALHYKLDLDWRRKSRTLRGVAVIRFRATRTADRFTLDLAHPMRVRSVRLDGHRAAHAHPGKNLVVREHVRKGSRHTLRVVYAGTPKPVRGPASRPDIAHVGMRVTKGGQLWTMQEPFGAYTWYPAHDQPSDKALYDLRVSVPGAWVGVSNGELVSRTRRGGRTVTRWHSAHPMASYLVTLAVGPYRMATQTGPHGVPLTYWVPRGRPGLLRALRTTPQALRWLEKRLGRYPFERAGVLVTPSSSSAMETQTLVTFGAGNYRYGTRDVRRTVVHELAHQWYGDTVTPRDWRDVWMNEGMATYQDTRWAVAQGWTTWRHWQRQWKRDDQLWRDIYGPPGRYRHHEFGAINVYYCTALMWDRLRKRVGTAQFDDLVRGWIRTHHDTNQSRASLERWWERRSGEELSAFFDRWLNHRRSPARAHRG
jgi:aminopeptidase N